MGIRNLLTSEIVYYKLGDYCIKDPTLDINISGRTIQINLLDKMAFFSNDISGQLLAKTTIDSGLNIATSIQTTITNLGYETNYLIDTVSYTTSYKIEKEAGDSIYSVLETLANLYLTYKCFYDVNGVFHYQKIKNGINDPVAFDFSNYNIIQKISKTINYPNIKNQYKIIGKLLSTGTQYTSSLSIYSTDVTYGSSPFCIDTLNEPMPRIKVVTDDNLQTQEQCDDRLEYEIYKGLTLCDSISFTSVPLPFLDVDQIVNIDMSDYGINDHYLIDSINLSLRYDGLMSVNAHKVTGF